MIIQNEINGSVPEKEQIALKNIQQEILIGEQKVRQLQNAQRQVNTEIQVALETKSQVEEVIYSLKKTKDEIENSIIPLQREVGDLTLSRNQLSAELKTVKDEHVRVVSETNKAKTNIAGERLALEADKEAHLQAAKKLALEKSLHEEKVNRLLNALN